LFLVSGSEERRALPGNCKSSTVPADKKSAEQAKFEFLVERYPLIGLSACGASSGAGPNGRVRHERAHVGYGQRPPDHFQAKKEQ